jgi:hypothetical protein
MQTIENRARIDGKSICEVVRSSAFPWHKKQKSWKPNEEALTIFFRARTMLPVVSEQIYFFNNAPFKTFGKFAVKIEDHYFYSK